MHCNGDAAIRGTAMNRFGGLIEGGCDGGMSTPARSCRSRLTGCSIARNVTLLCGNAGPVGPRQSHPAAHETFSATDESTVGAKETIFRANESSFVPVFNSEADHETIFAAHESTFRTNECSFAPNESTFGANESIFAPNEGTFASHEYSFAAHESTFVPDESSLGANDSSRASEAMFHAVQGHCARRATGSPRGPYQPRRHAVLRFRIALPNPSMKVRSRVPTSRSHAKSPPPGMRSTVFG
jgi:hypothetical protein